MMKAKVFRRVECSVRGGADVVVARVEGREMARELGFDPQECSAIETAISELAWNAVRHAAGGRMIFTEVSESGRSGLEIVCVDRGPGMGDPSEIRERGGRESADRREGTGAPGLGIGLPLIHRVMDEIEIVPREGGGARVTARKWRDLPSGERSVEFRQPVPPSAGSLEGSPAVYPAGGLTCAVLARPLAGGVISGDACLVRDLGRKALLCMVDGLGHGPEAEKASRRVVDYAADHAAEDLGYILRGAHETLRETRGAAAGFVSVDGEAGEIRYLGVGNVELRVLSDRVIRPVASNGILGQEIGRVREERIPYRPGDLIVLHTDGISQRFTLEEIPGIRVVTPSHAAAWIMEHYGKSNDDATILVAR